MLTKDIVIFGLQACIAVNLMCVCALLVCIRKMRAKMNEEQRKMPPGPSGDGGLMTIKGGPLPAGPSGPVTISVYGGPPLDEVVYDSDQKTYMKKDEATGKWNRVWAEMNESSAWQYETWYTTDKTDLQRFLPVVTIGCNGVDHGAYVKWDDVCKLFGIEP